MRSWVSPATSDLPFKARETVEAETPAALATSWIVTDRFFLYMGGDFVGNDTGIVTGIVTVIIARTNQKVNIY